MPLLKEESVSNNYATILHSNIQVVRQGQGGPRYHLHRETRPLLPAPLLLEPRLYPIEQGYTTGSCHTGVDTTYR